MSQDLTFTQAVNKLFFGVDISGNSGSIFDSLTLVPQLKHYYGARQWNLNVTIEMNSEKAWSSRYEFRFTQSPMKGLNFESGVIEVVLGETESTNKLLNIFWRLQFNSKEKAFKAFEILKKVFEDVSSKARLHFGKDLGHMAEFSSRKQVAKGINDITLFLKQSPISKKYEIGLFPGNDLMSE
jgi:hypothetical protein